jgi:hypothetical protein
MPLRRVLRSTTERELKAWVKWLDEQMDVPDRADYYQMQTAAAVHRGLVKGPRRVKLTDFRLRFTQERQPSREARTPEEELRRTKAAWFAALGMKPLPEATA